MKKVSSLNIVFFMFIVAIVHSLALCGNSPGLGINHIRSVTAITEVFGDGQKLTAVCIESDKSIKNSSLSNSGFSVEGRTITYST